MCGICGFTGKREDGLLRRMAQRIAHRGPDGEGVWSDGRVNLASRRLAIVDLDEGKQPMCDRAGRVCLVWNGEVYNHAELRRQLEERGHVFRTSHSDTEVLVEMYLEYGPGFVTELNGMFAIALWDCERETLFLYRDRMGVKPLYYSLSPKGVVLFASEIKAMQEYPDCGMEWNDRALYHYFSFKNVNAPETAYRDIYSVMPGEMIICPPGGRIERKRYWQLSDYYSGGDGEASTEEEIVDRIRELLEDSVKIRMRADVRVGSFLSGGLDSSLVSAIASGMTEELASFTLGHEVAHAIQYEKESDVLFARKLAERYGIRHVVHRITAGDVIERMDRIAAAFDEPFSGAVSTYLMAEVMSREVKAALSGDGADELFGSYLPHMMSFPMEYYAECKEREVEPEKDKLRPMEKELAYLDSMYQFSGGQEDLLSYRILLLTDEEKGLFLSDRFGEYVRRKETLRMVREARSRLTGRDVLNRNLQYDSEILLPDQVLKYTDMLSMAHSLEVRTPFLDHRLVEYLAGLPGHLKMRGGETKYLLKKAAEKYLPKEMIYREKEGFVMPVNDWLPYELREYVLDTLSADAVARYDVLRPEAVYFVLQKYYENPEENSYLAGSIWNFVCFQKWCEQKDSG